MKNIINVEVKTQKVDFTRCKTDMLSVGIFSDAKGLDKLCAGLNRSLTGAISRLIKLGDFKGKEGTSAVVYSDGRLGAERLLLVGLGEKKKATADTVRKAAANAAKKAVEMKLKTLSLALHRAFVGRFDPTVMGQACAEGIYFGSYLYDEFVTETDNGRLDSLKAELVEPDSARAKKLDKGISSGIIIGKAQSYARTLSNRPGNVINPAALAAEAKKLAKAKSGLNCTVFDEKQLAAKSMGGILAVGSGSASKPKFIVLKYSSASRAAGTKPTIGLVGKAITFDSGGISVKPSSGMQDMKFDKSGGIVVLATLKAVAELKLPLNIYGIIPAAENLLSGSSYRPGDIVTTFSGKTVEIQNTDAEGRMTLCDGLGYAVRQKCDIIIDIATLTSACMIALGRHVAGLMGNDDKLMKQLQKAGEASGEKLWPMPSGDEYAQEIKSKIADLKNIGGKWGGACTAAAFLGQFATDVKWAHIDMDGDMYEIGETFERTGSRGFGVRLLTTYLMNLAGGKL